MPYRWACRFFAAFLLLPILSGCGIPPIITALSYVGDGVLIAATGKSPADMGVSLAMDQDCASLRLLRDEPMCRPNEPVAEAGTLVPVAAEESAAVADEAPPTVVAAAPAETQPKTLAVARPHHHRHLAQRTTGHRVRLAFHTHHHPPRHHHHAVRVAVG